jgi:hypothetical protein
MRAIDERDVGKRLRKISYLSLGHRIVLFRKQAYIVSQFEQPFKELHSFLVTVLQYIVIDQPKAARKEDTFRALQPVNG